MLTFWQLQSLKHTTETQVHLMGEAKVVFLSFKPKYKDQARYEKLDLY